MGNGVRVWLEERTGLPSAIRHFLDEDIPASTGWPHVLGNVALFAFLIQAATGLHEVRHRVDHFTIHIELPLLHGQITDADRPRSAVSG